MEFPTPIPSFSAGPKSRAHATPLETSRAQGPDTLAPVLEGKGQGEGALRTQSAARQAGTEAPAKPPLEPQPEPKRSIAPQPSYAPILLALGITMLFWGLVTSPIMSLGGLVIFIWAAWTWIRQIAQASRSEHEREI